MIIGKKSFGGARSCSENYLAVVDEIIRAQPPGRQRAGTSRRSRSRRPWAPGVAIDIATGSRGPRRSRRPPSAHAVSDEHVSRPPGRLAARRGFRPADRALRGSRGNMSGCASPRPNASRRPRPSSPNRPRPEAPPRWPLVRGGDRRPVQPRGAPGGGAPGPEPERRLGAPVDDRLGERPHRGGTPSRSTAGTPISRSDRRGSTTTRAAACADGRVGARDRQRARALVDDVLWAWRCGRSRSTRGPAPGVGPMGLRDRRCGLAPDRQRTHARLRVGELRSGARYGTWTQLWGMWLAAVRAWGLSWRAISKAPFRTGSRRSCWR